MQLEVIKVFADALTYRMYAVGQVINIEDEERANLMIERGFCKSLETKAEPKAKAKATPKAKTTAKKTTPKSGKKVGK